MNEKVHLDIRRRKIAVNLDGLTELEVHGLAKKVSDKMDEVESQNRKIADTSLIAILAALHLAAELDQSQNASENRRRALEHKLDHVLEVLKAALSSAGFEPQ